MSVQIGEKVREFRLPVTGGGELSLSELQGSKVVIYFYPKDSTSGCTTEGNEFSALMDQFAACNCKVFGISRDSIKSHENFKAKQDFRFELLSDKEEIACGIFDVIKEKMMYGKISLGIERSTFLLDEQGILRHEWRKVKAAGHAESVLQTLQSM